MIAAVASSPHISGVSRHAANMARSLLTRTDVSAIHIVVAAWQYDAMRGVMPREDARLQVHRASVGRGALRRNLWYYGELPRVAARLEADVVHLAYPAPLKRRGFSCPTVVTLHDFYPYEIPANFGFPKMLFNRAILRQCLRSVDSVACVSESTRQRLEIYTSPSVQQKAVTIYNCVDPGPAAACRSPLPRWDGGPFLLCVAQHRRNKNIVLAVQIFNRLLMDGDISPTARLVVVGIEGPETGRLQRFIRKAGLSRQVVLLRGVSDAELQWCYSHCELLLAPSILEGFGLPVVEAMLHRCPVVCSDISVFREIGGSYCHYAALGPGAVEAFADAARMALTSVQRRAPVTERFTGARIADSYLQLYTRLRNTNCVRPLARQIPVPP